MVESPPRSPEIKLLGGSKASQIQDVDFREKSQSGGKSQHGEGKSQHGRNSQYGGKSRSGGKSNRERSGGKSQYGGKSNREKSGGYRGSQSSCGLNPFKDDLMPLGDSPRPASGPRGSAAEKSGSRSERSGDRQYGNGTPSNGGGYKGDSFNQGDIYGRSPSKGDKGDYRRKGDSYRDSDRYGKGDYRGDNRGDSKGDRYDKGGYKGDSRGDYDKGGYKGDRGKGDGPAYPGGIPPTLQSAALTSDLGDLTTQGFSATDVCSVWAGGLPRDIQERDLRAKFEEYGPLEKFQLKIPYPQKGKTTCAPPFAFMT